MAAADSLDDRKIKHVGREYRCSADEDTCRPQSCTVIPLELTPSDVGVVSASRFCRDVDRSIRLAVP